MKLQLASHAGFCFGVRRAVERTLALSEGEGTLYTLGDPVSYTHLVRSADHQGKPAGCARRHRCRRGGVGYRGKAGIARCGNYASQYLPGQGGDFKGIISLKEGVWRSYDE